MSTSSGEAIGVVARRVGVPISTLRWWERCGVISPSGERVSGRRRYTEDDVRRAVTVHLWQTTAAMSLEEIKVFLAGQNDDQDWRDVVLARRARCEQQISDLTAAVGALDHLLQCPSEHPAQQCHVLAEKVEDYLRTRP